MGSDQYCNGDCPYGSLADMINYKSEGCDIDWVTEHVHTPYAFTWEIYVGPEIRGDYIEKAHDRASGRDDLSLVERSSQRLRGKSRFKQHGTESSCRCGFLPCCRHSSAWRPQTRKTSEGTDALVPLFRRDQA